MVSDQQLNTALGQLDSVIDDVTSHIQDFAKSPNDFTRNRKLNATTTIKVTLNMQGNSLNTELIDAFPNPAREGRSDKPNMKPKSAVWFVYRVA